MPQLKIVDVKKQVEDLEKAMEERLNKKFADLVEDLKHILQEANVKVGDGDTLSSFDDKINKVKKEISKLRSDVGNHVTVYNKHIMQQHGKRK